jgi:RimJ/RimL family protein N-acetyltransferase
MALLLALPPDMEIERVTLEGQHIRLEPLSRDRHLEGLQDAGAESSIFEWFDDDYSTPAKMETFVTTAIEERENGDSLPFATVWRQTGEPIGSTRFCNLRPENRSVEIGWTWVTPEYQRTPASTEAKYLMLRHAFEEWNCVRVEFETAAQNERSRDALARIGATEEGILRKHMLIHGEPQNSAYFSIIEREWPEVEDLLTMKLDRPF